MINTEKAGEIVIAYPQPVTTKGKIGRFAMADQDYEEYSDIFIFIPEKRQVIRIAEGSGDNLLHEDIKNGYVDYIYYDQYELGADAMEIGGGLILLEEMLRDKYCCMADCIPDVLDMAYGCSIEFIILA